jgi:hypothetical protein
MRPRSPAPRKPWKLDPGAGRASSRTVVPTAKDSVHVPEPFPAVIVQSIPAGCDATRPLPLPPGRIEMLPRLNVEGVQAVMIA